MDNDWHLPEWVETQKDDGGHSYFAKTDYCGGGGGGPMIYGGTLIPFRAHEWQVGDSVITVPIKPFPYAFVMVATQR